MLSILSYRVDLSSGLTKLDKMETYLHIGSWFNKCVNHLFADGSIQNISWDIIAN